MLALPLCLAAACLVPAVRPSSGSNEPAVVAVGGIKFEETSWGRGSSPTLTFSVSSGRSSTPEKVAAFLYFSEEPHAFQTSPFPPQFVGVLTAPASVVLTVYPPPERTPINEFTREKFVQGALFDMRGALLNVTNEEYLDIEYDAPKTTYSMGFETEDDFTTPLVNGQDLSTPPEFGRLFNISSRQRPTGAPHFGPAIFDSNPLGPNHGPRDPDLLVGTGNILILQEISLQTVPGIFNFPDDTANGGTFVFDFAGFGILEKVEPRSVDLIDVDASSINVTLTDVLGKVRVFSVPPKWTEDVFADGPPGYRTLDLTTLAPQAGFASTATATSDAGFLADEVARVEIALLGAGAIDNLVFAREADNALIAEPRSPISGGPKHR